MLKEKFADIRQDWSAKFQSTRCLIVIATYYGLKLEEMDVVTAFLNPDVEEEI